MDDLIEKIYSRLLEIDEIEEASTLAGGAITGVTTPLGAGPRGPVTYKDSDSTDRKHRKKSKKSKTKTTKKESTKPKNKKEAQKDT